MMDYGVMSGGVGLGVASGMMAFAWLSYILVIVLLGLGIAALWKYIYSK